MPSDIISNSFNMLSLYNKLKVYSYLLATVYHNTTTASKDKDQ